MGGVDGSALDLLLVAAVGLFAISGFRQGLVVGLLSFVGFFGGGLLGAQLASPIAKSLTDSATVAPLVGIVVVFVAASLGQLFAVTLGGSLRQRLTWRPARLVDSAGGAVVSAVSVLLVAWMVATPVASSPYPALASQVRRSVVINAVDHAVPDVVRNLYDGFRRLVDRGGFPEIFGSLAPTRVRPVAPPDPKVLNSTAVRNARASILKITGVAGDCSRRLEGSGFVYAPQRVMTNAHVVAGVRSPRVEVDGRRLEATVVLYDPRRDVAVLRVPELRREPLSFAGPARDGAPAVVAGYPEDGPFNVVAARVRGTQVVRGPDIYQSATVSREVYALRAKVRSGNSGGPLLAADGRVYGVVFAAAADDADTGFALTAKEVGGDAAKARTATQRVDTQGCD